jgi:hypothetical protein
MSKAIAKSVKKFFTTDAHRFKTDKSRFFMIYPVSSGFYQCTSVVKRTPAISYDFAISLRECPLKTLVLTTATENTTIKTEFLLAISANQLIRQTKLRGKN